MGRPKPSTFQPRGIELMDVSGLYSDAQLRSIVKHIGDFSEDRRAVIAVKILDVAGWLNARLHYEQAPTGPEMRVALEPIAAKLAELRATIDALDPHTRAALEAEAGRAPPDLQTERLNPCLNYGSLRVDRACEHQKRLDGWVRNAMAALPKGKPGPKGHEPFKEAAFYLVEIWKHATPLPVGRQTAIEPTVRQLTNLLRESMRPVCLSHGVGPKLTAAAKAVLDDGWRPEWQVFASDWLTIN